MKKVSIIIPVYNAMTSGGGHLSRCIESVLNQENFSLDDVEMLIINDGSKDNSQEVINRFSKKYPKTVRSIEQKNMGVAKTRNRAVEMARGTYVIFIDQDDWIDKNYVSTLYDEASVGSYDYVISGYKRPNQSKDIIKKLTLKKHDFKRFSIMPAWAKIHRTKFLLDSQIKFFDSRYGEDIPFTIKEYFSSDNYKTINYNGYNWYLNETSVSQTLHKGFTDENIQQILALLKELKSLGKQLKLLDNSQFKYLLLRVCIYAMLYSGRRTETRKFLEVNNIMFDWLKKNTPSLTNKKGLISQPKIPRDEYLFHKIVTRLYVFMYKTKSLYFFSKLIWQFKSK